MQDPELTLVLLNHLIHHQVHQLVISLEDASHYGELEPRRIDSLQFALTLSSSHKLDSYALVDVVLQIEDILSLLLLLFFGSTTSGWAAASSSALEGKSALTRFLIGKLTLPDMIA